MRLSKLAAGAILGAGFLAASAMSASAAIVCSGNVCWHTHETYTYPPESRVIIHEDNCRAGPQEKFSFRIQHDDISPGVLRTPPDSVNRCGSGTANKSLRSSEQNASLFYGSGKRSEDSSRIMRISQR